MKTFNLPDGDFSHDLVKKLSEVLNIETEFLEGDISFGERISIPLKNGKTLIFQSHDADSASHVSLLEKYEIF